MIISKQMKLQFLCYVCCFSYFHSVSEDKVIGVTNNNAKHCSVMSWEKVAVSGNYGTEHNNFS